MNWMVRIVAAAALSLGASAASAVTISVMNGSFELPRATAGGFDTLAPGSGDLTGWTISNANIDHIGTGYWQASDGVQSVDLNGSQGPATISQEISGFEVGKSYTLYFDLSGNPEGGPAVKTLDVNLGMALFESFSFDTTSTDNDNMGWETQMISFIAGATEGVLSFASTTDGAGACCWGPALDNVRIAENEAVVPVPAGGLLLATGLVGLAWMRRRRS